MRARAPPSIALPDYRLEQKSVPTSGERSFCPPIGCGRTEEGSRESFNLFARLDALLWERGDGGSGGARGFEKKKRKLPMGIKRTIVTGRLHIQNARSYLARASV